VSVLQNVQDLGCIDRLCFNPPPQSGRW